MPPQLYRHHCSHCNVAFNTYDTEKKFCTDSCECLYKCAQKARQKSFLKSQGEIFPCSHCGNLFKRGNKYKRYCNQACQIAHAVDVKRQKVIDKYRKKTCPMCSEEFVANERRKYCSYICSNKKAKEDLADRQEARRIEKTGDPVKKRRLLPYHVLNVIEERKRLSEAWNRLT